MTNLDFKNLIDVTEHSNKISLSVQEIKSRYVIFPGATAQYLNAITEFFLADIKKVADLIYENVTLGKETGNIVFTSLNLRSCISNGIQNFFVTYDAHISNYNMGMMFSNHDDIERYKISFFEQAKQALKKQADLIDIKYKECLKSHRYNFWLLAVAIVAAFAAVVAAIPIVRNFVIWLLSFFNIHIV
jgi:hypothetical protein